MPMTPAEQRYADGVKTAVRAVKAENVGTQYLTTRDVTVTVPKPEVREAPNGSGGSKLLFTGYASVYDAGYRITDHYGTYEERVRPGAFARTLADGADYAFLINHEGNTLARSKAGSLTTDPKDTTGFLCRAELSLDMQEVRTIKANVESGNWDEMSFAFRVTDQTWNDDYTERDIAGVDMHRGDQSVVNFGANPATGGLTSVAVRQQQQLRSALNARSVELRSALGSKFDALLSDLEGAPAATDIRSVLATLTEASDEQIAEWRNDPALHAFLRRMGFTTILIAPDVESPKPQAERMSVDLARARAWAMRRKYRK